MATTGFKGDTIEIKKYHVGKCSSCDRLAEYSISPADWGGAAQVCQAHMLVLMEGDARLRNGRCQRWNIGAPTHTFE